MNQHLLGVGQHPGRVGQHETEWWVSMLRNIHFKGIIRIKIDQNHSFKMFHYGFQLENEIFWKGLSGGWEKESIKLWVKLCSLKNQTILDIGANTGLYSLVAKALNHDNNVIALEPVSRVFQKLIYNVKLNTFNIDCLQLAASSYSGKATIFDTGSEHIYSVTVNKNLNEESLTTQKVLITTITLDSLIKTKGLQNIDLIKIDVETHEPEVLEGFKEHLEQFRPSILIEVLSNEIAVKIESLVKNCNYRYFNINEKYGTRRTERIRVSENYNYLLCSEETAKRIGLEV